MNPSIAIAQNCHAMAGRIQPTAGAVADPGPLADLGTANTRLYQAADGLEKRLAAVLRPSPPALAQGGVIQEPTPLREFVRAAHGAADVLESILARIDL